VASWEDVRRIALALPESSERRSRERCQWRVEDKLFVWHLSAKEALLADEPGVYFTTPHFDGYPAILVRLEKIAADELDEVIVEAWLCRAPKSLAQRYIDTQLPPVS